MPSIQKFNQKGWCKFSYDDAIIQWIAEAQKVVSEAIEAPENADWIRCNGTWFVGVNALPNDENGAVKNGRNLQGHAIDFIKTHLTISPLKLDCGQISICYPGYPKQSDNESDSSYNYRLTRDAAHIDGLLPEGPDRRRHLREPHAFILGIPLRDVKSDTSPLVIWEGSHILAHEAFSNVFRDIPPDKWGACDITSIYHDLRKRIFKSCKRTVITAKQGEAYLIHRLALHGMVPWASITPQPEGRAIIYFRPELDQIGNWL